MEGVEVALSPPMGVGGRAGGGCGGLAGGGQLGG